ncbi:neuropeptide-like 1 isoform X2 [Pseudomyrmex gracilis]|uniref:neuropeptide-like 1 isoform X2 n=1 Tax=Pseudomyrmex gracilis TaxID=219809 RepID=UPI000995A543|nr:neuropeptide-like 1 isoform X2 [Pseudomyrmex gracilis]
MRSTGNYLVSLLFYAFIVNVIRLPPVTCQDEEGSQCIPKKMFMELLRLPEVNSNLAAYSRTARIIQEAKNHMAHLKALSSEENDDAEICIPGDIYLELFRNPRLREYLNAMARTHKLLDIPERLLDEEIDMIPETGKRSLATLAKNGDLPVTIRGDDHETDDDDEEKRSISIDDNMRELLEDYEMDRRRMPQIYDYLSEVDPEVNEYSMDKRNVGTLARDFALPTGRRHIASVARDYGLPSGKRNVGSLARQSMLPSTGKRNVAALARDSSLPYGKRYLGSLVRNGGYPRMYDENKRSIASLARNRDFPVFEKRKGGSASGRMMARVLSRHGRSLSDDRETQSEPLDLQQLIRQGHNGDENGKENAAGNWQIVPFSVLENLDDTKAKNRSNRRMDATSQTRHKRQLDFSDEYPLPVMQSNNLFDYEDMLEALGDRYPNAEKRFLGRIPQMGPRPTTPPTRRLGH